MEANSLPSAMTSYLAMWFDLQLHRSYTTKELMTGRRGQTHTRHLTANAEWYLPPTANCSYKRVKSSSETEVKCCCFLMILVLDYLGEEKNKHPLSPFITQPSAWCHNTFCVYDPTAVRPTALFLLIGWWQEVQYLGPIEVFKVILTLLEDCDIYNHVSYRHG